MILSKQLCVVAGLLGLMLSACQQPLDEISQKDHSGDIEILPGDSLSEQIISVAEARQYYETGYADVVNVGGYIVGCIVGTNISNAVFMPPFTTVSNILLADDTLQFDPKACLPVELASRTELRDSINLCSNPGQWHRKVVVCGKLEKYFRQAGIRNLESCHDWEAPSEDSIEKPVVSQYEIPVENPGTLIHGGR